MKKLITTIVIAFALISCGKKGETDLSLNGDAIVGLPPELKGLKVYYVQVSSLRGVYVAVMDGYNSTSTTTNDKSPVNTILLQPSGINRIVKDTAYIIMENDSIIVARKK